MRFEYTFSIPVLSADIQSFIQKPTHDEYHPASIAKKSMGFIQQAAKRETIKFPFLFEEVLQELIENCYDSYAKKGLVIGKTLRITLIIQKNDSQFLVKLKDNGSGFFHQEKGKYFWVASVKPEHKEQKKFNGGEGVGLRSIQAELNKAAIGLFLKIVRKQVLQPI